MFPPGHYPNAVPLHCTLKVFNWLPPLCLHTGWVRLSGSAPSPGSGRFSSSPLMWPLASVCGLNDPLICDAISLFPSGLNRLGLTQWEGIEQDIAWGHVTSLLGLARPSIEGPIFIYRAPCRLGGQSPHRVRLMASTGRVPNLC